MSDDMDRDQSKESPKRVQPAKYLGMSGVAAAMQARHEAMLAVTQPLRDMIRVQQEVSRTLFKPLQDAIRVREALSQSILKPFPNLQKLQGQLSQLVFRPFDDMLRTQRQLSRLLLGNLLDTSAIAKQVTELSGIATQFSRLARFDLGIDLNAFVEAAIEEAKRREAEEDQRSAHDDIFANYHGQEFDFERAALTVELAKVRDFEQMPDGAKFIQLVRVAVKHPSSKVQTFALSVAGGLLANILSGNNSPFWLAFFFLIVLVSQAGMGLRVRQTRQVLRNVPIDKRNTRIVGYACTIFDQPKAKSLRIGRLELGAVVTTTDKLQGWREVYFVDGAGQQRIGWVRSKYLRKV